MAKIIQNPATRFMELVALVPDKKLQEQLKQCCNEIMTYVTEGIDSQPNYERVDFGSNSAQATTDIFTELGSYFQPQKRIA